MILIEQDNYNKINTEDYQLKITMTTTKRIEIHSLKTTAGT